MAKQIKMPCGWTCGALLNSTEMRKHFGDCPNRKRALKPAKVEPVGLAATDARSIVRAATSRANVTSDGVTTQPWEPRTPPYCPEKAAHVEPKPEMIRETVLVPLEDEL